MIIDTTFENITADHITSEHVTSDYITSDHITTAYTESDHVTSEHITSKHVTSEYVISDHLTSKHITSTDITAPQISSSLIKVDDCVDTNKTIINAWLGFTSKLNKQEHPFKLRINVNPETNQDTLCFITNEYSETKSKLALALDKDRFFIANTLNLKKRTIETSLGNEGDVIGDISVDENYFYYCIKSYDGTSKIWKRCTLSDW